MDDPLCGRLGLDKMIDLVNSLSLFSNLEYLAPCSCPSRLHHETILSQHRIVGLHPPLVNLCFHQFCVRMQPSLDSLLGVSLRIPHSPLLMLASLASESFGAPHLSSVSFLSLVFLSSYLLHSPSLFCSHLTSFFVLGFILISSSQIFN